jgi:hypothetical protein
MTGRSPTVKTLDLAACDYDRWLESVFGHEAPAAADTTTRPWYHRERIEVLADPERQVAYMTRLFQDPTGIRKRFTPEQIEQGFWFMFGASREAFRDFLWDPEIPWVRRAACIEAIPNLYEGLFPDRNDDGGVAWMLWDLLADDYGFELRDPGADVEDRRVQDAMLEALRVMLLRSRSVLAQRAALHGVFHLAHPKGPGLIRTFLESGRPISTGLRAYAEAVLKGDAL